MNLRTCFNSGGPLLMEGALGERLKREYGLSFAGPVAMAELVLSEAGRNALRSLWTGYAAIARRYGLPFLATTPTRRANRERMRLAGHDVGLLEANVRFLREIERVLRRRDGLEMYVGGLMGCRGDAYTGEGALPTAVEAREFHDWQARGLKDAGADFLYAGIMPTLPEAQGMAEAMADTGLPYIISFTIEAGGTLADGTPIHTAIAAIDRKASPAPLCYMANCVHPSLVRRALSRPWNRTGLVRERFLGLQANASSLSHAELDGAGGLHGSDPEALADEMLLLRREAGLRVLGGCCGTDDRHMEAVAERLSGAWEESALTSGSSGRKNASEQ